MSSLTVSTRRDASQAIVSLAGDLDLATVPSLRDAAMAELDAESCTALVLDCDGLTFLDSTGLGCWIELRNHAESEGKQLELRAVPKAARRTVTMAGLAPLFGLDAPPSAATPAS